MNEDVKITAHADGGDVVNLLERIASSFERIADRSQHAGGHGQDAFGKLRHGAVEVAQMMTGISSAMSIVEKTWEAIVGEIDRYFERLEHKGEAFVEFGEARRRLLRGTAAGGAEQATAALKELTETGIAGPGQIASALSAATFGRDQAGQARGLTMAKALAKARPELFESGEAGEVLKSLMHLVSNDQRPLSDEQAVALYSASARAAGGNPDLRGAVDLRHLFGDRDDESRFLSMQAGISRRLGDPEQGSKLTHMLMTRLYKRAQGAGFKGSAAEMDHWLRSTEEGRGVVADMLGAMSSQDENEFAGFGAGAIPQGRGGQYFATSVEFLRGLQGETNATTGAIARATIPPATSTALVAGEQARQRELMASHAQRAIEIKEAFKGAGAAARLSDNVAQEKGNIRKQLDQFLESIGVSKVGANIDKAFLDFQNMQANSTEQVERNLLMLLRRIQKPAVGVNFFGSDEAGTAAPGRELSAAEKSENAIVDRLIEKVEELIEATREPKKITIEGGGEHLPARSAAEKAGQP